MGRSWIRLKMLNKYCNRGLLKQSSCLLRTKCEGYTHSKLLHYVQGQSPSKRVREYFYYIDHHGQLFLDDAKMKNFTSCFKEVDFLEFFFKRLRLNNTDRYSTEFPYLSLCGRERNFIRCDDLPIVFTHVITDTDTGAHRLCYGYAGDRLSVPFQPHTVCMLPWTGRIYHPGPTAAGGVGLIRSAMAIEWSSMFEFGPDDQAPLE